MAPTRWGRQRRDPSPGRSNAVKVTRRIIAVVQKTMVI
jgi:hypothetical protein